MRLSELATGKEGVVEGFDGDELILRRLMELGFTRGVSVVVSHRGLLGGDPLAVRVQGALIGIGRREADMVLVREESR